MNKKNARFEFSITGFLMGIILFGMFAGIFQSFLVTTADFASADSGALDELQRQNNNTLDLVEQIKNDSALSNEFDAGGATFFTGLRAGINGLETAWQSVGLYSSMVDEVSTETASIVDWTHIKNALYALILIIFTIGVLLSVLLRFQL